MVMLGLARRFAWRRPAALVASFLAIGLGALVIAVCGGLLETGVRSDVPPERLRAAPVVVSATQSYLGEALVERHRVDAALADRIAARPDVRTVVGDVSFPVTTAGGTRLTGHGWSSAQLTPERLRTGHAPTGAGETALSSALAHRLHLSIGARLQVRAGSRDVRLRIVGLTSSTPARDSLFVTDVEARSLLPVAGKVDLIAVYPARGVSVATLAARLEDDRQLTGLHVATGRDRGLAEFPDAAGQSETLIPMAAAGGGLMTGIAVFIIASTLSLSVQLRRRQIALLRAVGATPGQLRRLVLGEAFLLAVVAAVLGVLPSRRLGRAALAGLADHGLVNGNLVHHQGWIPTGAGVAGAVLTGVLAALVAARGAIRIRPVEALSADSAPEPWLGLPRLVFGVLGLGGAVALAIVTALAFDGPIAASTAEPSALLWALALGLLAPVIVRPLLALFTPIASWVAPRTGRLAAQTIRGRGARTAAVIVPVMLATGLTTALLYLQSTQAAATKDAYAGSLRADRVLTLPGGQLPPDLADEVRRLPGVTAVSPLIASSGFFEAPPGTHAEDATDIPLQGVGPDAEELVGYPVRAGTLTKLTGDTVAIPASERRHGRDLGDTVAIRLGDGTVAPLRIVAIITTPPGYPTLLLPAALLARHTTTGLADQILVATKSSQAAAALDRRLRSLAPGLVVSSRAAALDLFDDQLQTQAWISYLLIAGLILYTTISLINTTIAATSQRRPQFRSLRLLGAARHHVVRAMTIEALIVGAAGSALGTMFALATLLPFDSAVGAPGLPTGPWWIYPTVVGSATALTVLVTRTTTRLLDTRPLQS